MSQVKRFQLRGAPPWSDDYVRIVDTRAEIAGPPKIIVEADVTPLVFNAPVDTCDRELGEWAVERLNAGDPMPLRVPRLSREDRQKLVEMFPPVTRLKRVHKCTGWVTGASKTRGKYTCKNQAHWKYKHLQRTSFGLVPPRTGYYCWPHLVSRALQDMDEERRWRRFVSKPEIRAWIDERKR